MSPLLQVCAVIITGAIAVIAIATVRAMSRFEHAIDEFRKTADVARASIAEIDVVTRQIRELAVSVEGVVTPLQRVSARVARLGDRAVDLSDAVLTQIESPIQQTVALVTGVKAGTQTLFQRLRSRFGGRVGSVLSNGGFRHE